MLEFVIGKEHWAELEKLIEREGIDGHMEVFTLQHSILVQLTDTIHRHSYNAFRALSDKNANTANTAISA